MHLLRLPAKVLWLFTTQGATIGMVIAAAPATVGGLGGLGGLGGGNGGNTCTHPVGSSAGCIWASAWC